MTDEELEEQKILDRMAEDMKAQEQAAMQEALEKEANEQAEAQRLLEKTQEELKKRERLQEAKIRLHFLREQAEEAERLAGEYGTEEYRENQMKIDAAVREAEEALARIEQEQTADK